MGLTVQLTTQEIKALERLVSEQQNKLHSRFEMMHDEYGNVKSLWEEDVEVVNAKSKFFADLKDKLTTLPTFEITGTEI